MRHVYYWTQNAPFYKLNFKNLYAMGWDEMEWDAMGWDGMGWKLPLLPQQPSVF